ncbi:DNA polymerase eta isoform X1 [Pleurodeles waltl]|uniref:DNA polymerase eta isoform X1 n=1 Tax=Pleurodeles waltl TaxID=8319 RepID=UPI0037094E8D
MERGTERVVALVDMDCFYVQVEQKLNPALKNKPCVVVQYKTFKGGGIIAVSYEARAFGITKTMWANDAKKLCADLQLARVRESRGKADLTKYREASVEVIEVMSRFAVVERASIDEAFIDLTSAVQERLKQMSGRPVSASALSRTYVQGYPSSSEEDGWKEEISAAASKEAVRQRGVQQWLDSLPFGDASSPDLQLTVGAAIVEEMRAAVEAETGFQCSAGIAHNKMLSKLACGINKPNRQTLVPMGSVPQLFGQLPVSKIRHLGGKLGVSVCEVLGVEYMGQLTQFSESLLQSHFGDKTGSWLYDLCRGIDHDEIKPRQLPKSIGCSKNFPGKTALSTREQVQYWLMQLAQELEERLKKDREHNSRVAKLLTVSIRVQGDKRANSQSRCCALARYEAEKICTDAFIVLKASNVAGGHQVAWSPPLTLIQLSASKFCETLTPSKGGITGFLTSDASCTQRTGTSLPCSSTSTSAALLPTPTESQRKKIPSPKAPSAIQAMFERAKEKRKSFDNKITSLSGTETALHSTNTLNLSTPGSALDPNSSENGAASVELPSERGSFRSRPAESLQRPSLGNTHETNFSSQNDLSILESTSFTSDNETGDEYSLDCIETEGVEYNSTSKPKIVASPDVDVTPEDPSECALSFQVLPPFDAEDLVQCEKCAEKVVAWELPEHMDFHFALDLQNSFSVSSSSSITAPPSPALSSPLRGKSKGKSTPSSSAKRPKRDSSMTLDAFFKKTPR